MKGFGTFWVACCRSCSSPSRHTLGSPGFVEFYDNETASSAVRNLNGYEMDGRVLRVDHAEPEKSIGATRPVPVRGTAPTSGRRDANGLPTNLQWEHPYLRA